MQRYLFIFLVFSCQLSQAGKDKNSSNFIGKPTSPVGRIQKVVILVEELKKQKLYGDRHDNSVNGSIRRNSPKVMRHSSPDLIHLQNEIDPSDFPLETIDLRKSK